MFIGSLYRKVVSYDFSNFTSTLTCSCREGRSLVRGAQLQCSYPSFSLVMVILKNERLSCVLTLPGPHCVGACCPPIFYQDHLQESLVFIQTQQTAVSISYTDTQYSFKRMMELYYRNIDLLGGYINTTIMFSQMAHGRIELIHRHREAYVRVTQVYVVEERWTIML